MSDPDNLEALLEGQLLEHKQSAIEVETALKNAPCDEELLQLRGELDSSIREAEDALLEIKRARLLGTVEHLENGGLLYNSEDSSSGEDSQTSESSDVFNEPSEEGAILMESASQAARAAVITAAEQGQQNESRLFAAWEAHGRGVASKLMARMGYVQGKGLGREKQGVVDAVVPFSNIKGGQREGLGLNPNQGITLKKKRCRGGRQHTARRKRKAAEEATKDEDHAQEMTSGDQGLFQVINRAAGDDSEAAKILRYTVSNDSIRVPNGGVDDSSSLGFDRRAVVNHQDKVTVCKKRVIELKKMLQRNKDQKELCENLKTVLKEAEASLQAAQGMSDKLTAEMNKRDELRKWTKF